MHLTLKQTRLVKEKTQSEMAEMLGIHVDTYRKLEEKPENTTIKQAKMISSFLGVSYNDIFFAD
ncbi:MAG: helix-turn-helix transcriptional regulator [Phascolarctobacterium sp.]|nr:helix-turn-helix transcriptional regulator [Phascolarctobacterium sp.]